MNTRLLDEPTADTVRMSVAEARALGEAALCKIGFTQDEAAMVAEHLVDAATWGYEFAGLPRILVIAERPELQWPRQPVSVVKETAVSALLDGGNHVGYVSIPRAVDVVLEKVRGSGVAVVGLRNSWFAGRNAYYLERIARAGYAVVYFGSSTPTVVPPGAARKILGTNPLAIALPGKDNPFIFDMGTGAVMTGEIMLKSFLGEEFSEIVGINARGAPTRVASELKDGGVFPFGGHKGYGVSLAIQAMGLLAGSRFRLGEVSDFGSLFVAFDPELLMPREQFVAELDELLGKVKALPRQEGILVHRYVVERLNQICLAANSA